ncbi:MAG: hypothetical protein WCG25_09720 [bacterium]
MTRILTDISTYYMMNGAYKYRDDTNFQKEKTNINLNYNFFKMTEIEIKI